ncbi:MAG: hypothetical protein ACP5SD_02845 [Elusimicrobiales bacterium]
MFFSILLSLNLFSLDNSATNYTTLDSLYDKEFTNQTIKFFKENLDFDITTDTQSITNIYLIKRNGVSRTELIFLLKYLKDTKSDLSGIVKETEKNKDIFRIAKERGYPIDENLKFSAKIKKEIEKTVDDIKIIKPIIEKEFLNEKK